MKVNKLFRREGYKRKPDGSMRQVLRMKRIVRTVTSDRSGTPPRNTVRENRGDHGKGWPDPGQVSEEQCMQPPRYTR